MKKVSGRELLQQRPLRALRDNRPHAVEEANASAKLEADKKRQDIEKESARSLPVGKYPSLEWLITRVFVVRRR
jgi:hypothetical protein